MNEFRVLASGGSGLITPLTLFLAVVCLCFLLCLVTGMDSDTSADFYVAERSLPAPRSALALIGDHIPVTALLSPIGTVALSGYDSMMLAVSACAALLVLLVLAEPLRDTGRFTLGSVLRTRAAGTAPRIAGAVLTLVVCVPLIVVQLTVAGNVTAYVLGLDVAGTAEVCTALIGLLIISFAAFGGMRGTSAIQAGKALLLFGVVIALTVVAVGRFDGDFGGMLTAAALGSGGAEVFHAPGLLFGDTVTGTVDLLSLCLTVSLGSAVVPPILLRIGSTRDGRTARRATSRAVVMITLFHGAVVLLGIATAAVVGAQTIVADDPRGNSALFLLARALDGAGAGEVLFTVAACAVFVTALATVAGLALATAASLSHDVYARALRKGAVTDKQETAVARWAVVAVGVASVLLSLLLHSWSIVFLASFAAAVAASVILPALVYTLFWQRFTRRGMLWTLYGSLACCLLLQLFGPTVSGRPFALLPEHDFHWFPLQNIALVTVPVGFLLGWAGSRLRAVPPSAVGRRTASDAVHRKAEGRPHTGRIRAIRQRGEAS
ncbi:cation acetate symporter [Streptomyces sp. ms191]|uniref:sodium/solute symporter n=1 Tax=Streptomyces sp. ms191 TaxID=1827978 RepID=UPI0011CEC0DF|nr:cation acetate symporter [Streptomyces sp. ms191]TXS22211.1 cation acetate symporter [Streptomyces sp. ms191]